MVNNKFRIWIVKFGRTASLQIAYVAGPHKKCVNFKHFYVEIERKSLMCNT